MRILVATDFSPRSQRAVRRAGILGSQADASVILMHVVEGEGPREVARDRREALRMIAEQIEVVPELRRIPCEPIVVRGYFPDAVIDAAIAQEVDLIVVGAPHRKPARSAGRTVRELIRNAPCPVLVVRRFATAPYARVLAPIDLSDTSERALLSADSLRLADSAHVTVVHAFTALGKSKLSGAGVARDHIDSYVEGCRSQSAEEVDAFLAGCGLDVPPWSRRVEEGSPRDVIVRLAEQMPSDLVVIGTHGRTGIRKAILGSVTEDVLSTRGADVLVVPPPRTGRDRRARLATPALWPQVGQPVPRHATA